MRKLTALALTCLMISAAFTAWAAPSDATLMTDITEYQDQPYAMAAAGEMLYIAAGNAVYRWKAGDETPEKIAEGIVGRRLSYYQEAPDETQVVDDLFFIGDTLYALNKETGLLSVLSISDGAASLRDPVQLEWDNFTVEQTDYTYTVDVISKAAAGDTLYLLTRDWNTGDGSPVLYALDIHTGACQTVSCEHVQQIAAYKDGLLLAVVIDESDAWDPDTQTYRSPALCTLNPADGTCQQLSLIDGVSYYDMNGMTYDAASDTLFYVSPSKIYRMPALGASELCAYVPATYFDTSSGSVTAVLSGGMVAVRTDTGIYIRSTDPSLLPTQTLTVYGGYENNQSRAAQSALETVPVLFLNDTWYASAQELSQALVSGEDAIDVLCLYMNSIDFARLMEKGYCEDLSKSETLRAFTEPMYPWLKEAVSYEGALYAVPIEMYGYGFYYRPSLIEELGVELPTNLIDLCSFITDWGANRMEEYSGYLPLMWDSYRSQIFQKILDMYSGYMEYTGQDLMLDTPLFRELMAAYEQMNAGGLERNIDWDSADAEEQWNEMYSNEALIEDGYNYSLENNGYGEWQSDPLLMSLTKDTEFCAPMQVTVLMVNPNSKNKELAIRYIEAYCAAIGETSLAYMYPGSNAAILNPDYEKTVASLTEEKARCEAEIQKTTGDEQINWQNSLDYITQALKESEQRFRYLATDESIAEYRAVMEHAFVQTPSILYSGDSTEFYTLTERYTDGQITLEQFIQEGNAKLRLMILENQ